VYDRGYLQELVSSVPCRLGISVATGSPQTAVKVVSSRLIELVQLQYNVFRWRECEILLSLCHALDIDVVARSPFEAGGLLRKPDHVKGWRRGFFEGREDELDKKRSLLFRTAKSLGITPMEAALRFCTSDQRIKSVLVGASSTAQIEEFVKAASYGPLPEKSIQKLKQMEQSI
jgi:aryl-alcohol dehydrogenase-like predicted oxidoreductase